MEKFIIANCITGAGLCNRLKCLISAMRLADKYSRTLILCWHRDWSANCNFSDLFENKIAEITPEELCSIKKNEDTTDAAFVRTPAGLTEPDEKYIIMNTWRLVTLEEDDLPRNFSRAYWSETGRNIDFEYERIPPAVREKFLFYINKLIPHQYVAEQVKSFSECFDNDTMSVHIRSWIDYTPRASLFFRFDKIYAILDKINHGKLLISCDSSEVSKKINERYGNRVILYPKRKQDGDRNTVEGMQDTLCDLLLLSINKRLVASYYSSFSEMAWWFGGCRAEVSLIPLNYLFYRHIVICPPSTMIYLILLNRCIPIPRLIARRYLRLMRIC